MSAEEVEEVAQRLYDIGACVDCGCPLPKIETARAHAADDGFACDDWNEANPEHGITIVLDRDAIRKRL